MTSVIMTHGYRLTPLKPGEKVITPEKIEKTLELYALNIPMTNISTIVDLTIYSVKKILTLENVYVAKPRPVRIVSSDLITSESEL